MSGKRGTTMSSPSRRMRVRTKETVSETSTEYTNSRREREYLAYMQNAAVEVQSLRALLAGILIERFEGDTGTLTVAVASVQAAPQYSIAMEADDDNVTITLTQAPTEEEPDDNLPDA